MRPDTLAAARSLAAQLPPRPKHADLATLAEELARHAAPKQVPGRSVAKACDHLVADPAVREQLRALAREQLEALQPPQVPIALPIAEWVSLETAAVMYDLDPRWMRRALKHPQYRRMWGWPRCVDGVGGWRFRRAVASGEAVPIEEEEPPHLLPLWCLRATDVDMCVVPTVA